MRTYLSFLPTLDYHSISMKTAGHLITLEALLDREGRKGENQTKWPNTENFIIHAKILMGGKGENRSI